MNFDIDPFQRYFGNLKPNSEEDVLWYEKEFKTNTKKAITYKYNNEGFRCDDFMLKKSGMHILFGGDSETEGAANLLEDTWSHILYNKIKEEFDVAGYYNVGKSGLTIAGVIMNVFQYIYEYGKPDCIFLQLPDQVRYIAWDKDYGFVPRYPASTDDIKHVKSNFFYKNEDESSIVQINIFYSCLLFKTLIQFCNLNSIKLIWSSWHRPTAISLIEKSNSKDGYVDTSTVGKEHWDIKINDLKGRDGIHKGRGFHKIWASKFYEEFLNDKNIKKNNS